jgi:DNA topoisomerase II
MPTDNDPLSLVDRYQKKTPVEHILLRPQMYIGSIDQTLGPMWVLDQGQDEDEKKIVEQEIQMIPGLFKLYDEVLVNAYDQTIEDQTLTQIHVNIDHNQISVRNNGRGIPVTMHQKEKMYIPELIFGELYSSSHYNDSETRISGGLNGLGIKLTAIFSQKFTVEIGDPVNQKSFHQEYTANLSKKSKPIIKPYNKKDGYVQINFIPDFKYFKISELSDQMIRLMHRRVYDIAMIVEKKVKVYLNNQLILANDVSKYMHMITDSEILIDRCDNPESLNRWKIGISKSSGDNFKCISFVNSVNTYEHGTHVKHVMGMILKGLREMIEKKHKDTVIKDQMIKDQIQILVIATIENPSFEAQTKNQLTTQISNFGSWCQIDTKTIKKLYQLLEIDTLIEKMGSNLIQKQQVTKKVKGVPKLYDAHYAGTKKSSQCSLILTEGDSAKTMAISGLSVLNDVKKNLSGNDYYGVFPLRGKLLNVREATKKKIAENEEFINLKKIIGLEGNKQYTEENISDLRYGHIIIFCDADHDGDHIKGLILNMLDYFWPSLLKLQGFLKIFITPMIKTFQFQFQPNHQVNEFFSISAYNEWRKHYNPSSYSTKYYKGLGTSTVQEAKEYFSDLKKYLIDVRWDKDSTESINLAFGKDSDSADERKKWLKNYNPDNVIDFTKGSVTHSDFINRGLIHFSNYDNERSIPSLIDGMKPSQRKILFCAFKKNLVSDIKVAQFIGYISEKASYHHGETSLAKAIIAMCQRFCGANNLNLLVPSGQYGSRLNMGQDAASPRYIYTRLEEVTRLIFDPRDDILLDYLMDENFPIEPRYYVPIIPMILVNGAAGIGTGYSVFSPQYNPHDLIQILLEKLEHGTSTLIKHIKPWYLGFTGEIKKITNEQYEVLGKYQYDQESLSLRILEIPVGRSTESYKIFLEEDMGEYVSKIKNNSNESTVDFIVKLKHLIPEQEIVKKFQLSAKLSLSNIYLHDKDGKLKKYKGVGQIIDEYYELRLRYYDLRKQSILRILKDEIDFLEKKLKFIQFVILNRKIFDLKKSAIIDMLIKEKIIKPSDNQRDGDDDDGKETKKKRNVKQLKQSKQLKEENENYDHENQEDQGDQKNQDNKKSLIDILFRMPFQSFTKEKTEQLSDQIRDKKQEYVKIEKITIHEMWKQDLDKLKQYLGSIK